MMRVHRRHRSLWLPHDQSRLAALVRPTNLAFARLEPVYSRRFEAVLDLVFESNGRYAVVNFAILDAAFLIDEEWGAIVWPDEIARIVDNAVLRELERLLLPWLRSRVFVRCENEEVRKWFRLDAAIARDVNEALDCGFIGATRLAKVVVDAAPFVYAQRFVARGSAAVVASSGGNGAALLAPFADAVEVDLRSRERNELFERWFSTVDGLRPFAGAGPYAVAVSDLDLDVDTPVVVRTSRAEPAVLDVTVAEPVPLGVLLSFDPEDSAAARTFSVESVAVAEPARSSLGGAAPMGGSKGKILVLARENWSRIEDVDSETIRELSRRLTAEGFEIVVFDPHAPLVPDAFDLAHAIVGSRDLETIEPAVEALAARGIPIVLSTPVDDPRGEAAWGEAILLNAFRNSNELQTLDTYLRSIETRLLEADSVPAAPRTMLNPDPRLVRLLSRCRAVITSHPRESEQLQRLYGYAGPTVSVPPFIPLREVADVTAIAGSGDFILFHGPIDPRAAILQLVMAAELERLPLVVYGPVASSELHFDLALTVGRYTRLVPYSVPTPAEVEGLYARARTYVDVSWTGRGLGRFIRAASYGASLVASANGYAADLFPEGAFRADPGSVPSIRKALREAWEAGPAVRQAQRSRAAVAGDQVAALAGAVAAYQRAAAAPAMS